MSEPKLNIKEETSTKKTRSPPKKAKVEQTVPKKKKLKTDADKAAEKAQHLRFGKAELTPDELSRLSKAQKREMYAAHAARSAVHREVDQYVCWVYNQNGYDVGRTTANGLWQKSQHISEAEAKPGDLVFFKGTYDTPGMSHTGIYLGNGMMVSAGDPIKYANIHSSYWEKHLAGFGRLSK